ncbi:MAG: phosphoserine phosphatase SerB [Pseudomonadota bacterium]
MSLVATLIANPKNPVLSEDISTSVMKDLNSHAVYWLADGVACDIPMPDSTNQETAEEIIAGTIADQPIDFAIQQAETRRKKALIADMDSTMIDQECIDELADEAGFGKQVAEITARAMNGEIEFEPALRERVSLLKGLPNTVIGHVIENRIDLAAGGKQLVSTMRANGAYCALVSGGFTHFTGVIAEMLGFDEHQANILVEENSVLVGKVRDPILGRQAKAEAIATLSERLGIADLDFIAVGDGANDLAMLKLAGTGVALHAKPVVAAEAQVRIDHGDLTALLYLQGYRWSDFVS